MSNTATDNALVNNENHSSTEHDHLTVKQELNSKNDLTQRQMHSAFQPSDVCVRHVVFFSSIMLFIFVFIPLIN